MFGPFYLHKVVTQASEALMFSLKQEFYVCLCPLLLSPAHGGCSVTSTKPLLPNFSQIPQHLTVWHAQTTLLPWFLTFPKHPFYMCLKTKILKNANPSWTTEFKPYCTRNPINMRPGKCTFQAWVTKKVQIRTFWYNIHVKINPIGQPFPTLALPPSQAQKFAVWKQLENRQLT